MPLKARQKVIRMSDFISRVTRDAPSKRNLGLVRDELSHSHRLIVAVRCLAVSLFYYRSAKPRCALQGAFDQAYVIVAANVSDFSFGYRNSGYGYGVARRVAFAFDGKCYSSDNNP